VCEAIRSADHDRLGRLLAENRELATATIASLEGCGDLRTLLHIATDWPGNFPDAAATVATLIEAGADVNSRFVGRHAETPLHWAASSDDIEVRDALIDAGAASTHAAQSSPAAHHWPTPSRWGSGTRRAGSSSAGRR